MEKEIVRERSLRNPFARLIATWRAAQDSVITKYATQDDGMCKVCGELPATVDGECYDCCH